MDLRGGPEWEIGRAEGVRLEKISSIRTPQERICCFSACKPFWRNHFPVF
jgi:hypothetical protein